MATAGELLTFLGVTSAIAPGIALNRVASFQDAAPNCIVFAVDDPSLAEALQSAAGMILARTNSEGDPRVVLVKDPRLAFSQLYQSFFAPPPSGIHPSAVIEPGVTLGADCQIGPRVVIHTGTTLGDRVKVQAGAILGSFGFGYARGPDGFTGFPQIGTLWIGDDVEIGANTTIDRGALGETRIGRGTKIDNLVHIAHNCRIGEHVIIAAQVGMAGSCVIEDGAMLGGQVGLGENVTIGEGVMLGGQGGVLPGKRLEGKGKVFWGTPARPVREYLRDLARIRKS
jgi:UDP-3-O-[3-hydroxymyristoyl] glucosamine N-acyltransferase